MIYRKLYSKLTVKKLLIIFYLSINFTEFIFAQTSNKKPEELWNLRQSEIEELYLQGDLAGALNSAKQAVGLAEIAFGSNSIESISTLMLLAQIHSEMNQLEEANQIFQVTLEKSVTSFGEKSGWHAV